MESPVGRGFSFSRYAVAVCSICPGANSCLSQGLATIIVGIVSYWMVHDFPDEAKFLSPEDRARVIRRLKADKQSSAEHEEFKMDYFWASVKDWKTYAFAVIYMGCDGALYAFSLFLPTIINELVRNICLLPSHLG